MADEESEIRRMAEIADAINAILDADPVGDTPAQGVQGTQAARDDAAAPLDIADGAADGATPDLTATSPPDTLHENPSPDNLADDSTEDLTEDLDAAIAAAMAASKSSVKSSVESSAKLSGDGFSWSVSGGEVAVKSGVAPSAAPSAMSKGAAASSRAACVPCTPCAGVSPTGSASKMALMASAISAMRRISLSSSAINSSPSTLKATTMAWGQNAFALYRISISLYNNCRK